MRSRSKPRSGLSLLALLLLCSAVSWPVDGRGEDCLASGCHPALDALKNRHAPVAEGECGSCHRRLPGDHPGKGAATFVLTATGGELCFQCHELPGEGKIIHPPAAEGGCLDCHDPHGSSGRYQLRTGDNAADLCLQCHDDPSFHQTVLHGPVAAGACSACHDPHRSREKTLLKKPGRELCLGCHIDFAVLKEAPVSHPPVRNDPCTDCHQPHGAPVANLLDTGLPELCLNCHEKVGGKMEGAKSRHAPLYRPESCGGCHSTHYSDHRGLLPVPQETLCLSCHGKDDNSKSRALRNIGRELENRKFRHGPLQDGECAACHDPHGSDYFRMLSAPYPADFYAPYEEGTYDFCLQCHDHDLLLAANGREHTGFRNGKRNLHHLHAGDPRKARTCRACHEPHAADNPKLIRSGGAPFGDWKIPIRFQATPTGGSCAPGCHRPLAYDREKPAKNL